MPIRHSRLPARRVDHRRPTAGVVVVPRSVTADFGQFSPDEGRNRPPTREKTRSRSSPEERLRGARSLPPRLQITRKPSSVDPVLIPEIPAGSHSQIGGGLGDRPDAGSHAKHLRYASLNPAGPERDRRVRHLDGGVYKERTPGPVGPGVPIWFQ